MDGTTIGIIIAIIVIVGILVYVFKDKIFVSKGSGGEPPSGMPPTPPTPPTPPVNPGL